MDKFNNQFATQKLLEEFDEIDEMSTTGGGMPPDSGNSAKFVSGFGDQTAQPSRGKKKKKSIKTEAPSKPINLRAKEFSATDYQQATKSKSFKSSDYAWDEEKLMYVKKTPQVNENYSRFKKQTSTRSTEEQMHQAMKEVNKKLEEAGKLLQYTERLKTEITTLQELKSKKRTTDLSNKMQKKIAEVYSLSKKIK
jgi:hypothetical protein